LSRKDRYLSLRRSEAEVLLDLIARRMPLAPASHGREAALSA
jgi:hypothetical protein